ncbi:MAG: hypothetical protein MZV70_62695 [Desulfobacterales bacterium]|nr:hypothetical protein [Desulfobacterales bacterium]
MCGRIAGGRGHRRFGGVADIHARRGEPLLKLYSTPAFPAPSLDGVLSGVFGAGSLARIRAAAQMLHPGFPLAAVSAHLPALAGEADPMVRRMAAIAMGSAGTGFAGTLSSLVRQSEAEEVRGRRPQPVPAQALPGRCARRARGPAVLGNAERAPERGAGPRLGRRCAARGDRPGIACPSDRSAEPPGAVCVRRRRSGTGGCGEAGGAVAARDSLRTRFAVRADGDLGGAGQPDRIPRGNPRAAPVDRERGRPGAAAGSDGDAGIARGAGGQLSAAGGGAAAARVRSRVRAGSLQARGPAAYAAGATAPSFLRQRILQAPPPLATGACMVLSLGGASFANHADVLRARWGRDEQEMAMPLAITYEKITGGSIAPQD